MSPPPEQVVGADWTPQDEPPLLGMGHAANDDLGSGATTDGQATTSTGDTDFPPHDPLACEPWASVTTTSGPLPVDRLSPAATGCGAHPSLGPHDRLSPTALEGGMHAHAAPATTTLGPLRARPCPAAPTGGEHCADRDDLTSGPLRQCRARPLLLAVST